MSILGASVLVVHAVIVIYYAISRLVFGKLFEKCWFGHYCVLMPVGFIVYTDPSRWELGAIVVGGLLLISFITHRAYRGVPVQSIFSRTKELVDANENE